MWVCGCLGMCILSNKNLSISFSRSVYFDFSFFAIVCVGNFFEAFIGVFYDFVYFRQIVLYILVQGLSFFFCLTGSLVTYTIIYSIHNVCNGLNKQMYNFSDFSFFLM